jgi:hypothetical protein
MRAYVLVSGLLFTTLLLVHGVRLAIEGWAVLGNPVFVATTLCAAALALWAGWLWRLMPPPPAPPRRRSDTVHEHWENARDATHDAD